MQVFVEQVMATQGREMGLLDDGNMNDSHEHLVVIQ